MDAIVGVWMERDRAAFSSLPVWRELPAWQTAEERALAERLLALEERMRAAMAAFEAEALQLQTQRDAARTAAEVGPRRLLTTQGDELVDAVAHALTHIGFAVERGDAPGEQKRQDLTVRCGAFVAVVEVKGKARGGASGADLTQLGRHVRAFLKAHPDSEPRGWLVINGQHELPPDTRPPPFASDPEQIEAAQEADLLILPTTTLFRAVRDLPPEALRARLTDATGLFSMDPSPAGAPRSAPPTP